MTIEKVLQLARPNIRQLVPYSSARDEYQGKEGIFLDANENAFGSPIQPNYHRYPDPLQKEVKRKIAAFKKISIEQIFLGNGSDESIDVLLRTFCTPGKDEIIILPPTYGMYEVAARIHDVEIKKVLLDDNYQPIVKNILQQITSQTRIIFFCSPNNPTGSIIYPSAIEEVLNQFEGIVVVDEAYIDYAKTPSWIQQLQNYPNLVVLQTFSKAWGLAGIRAGMTFAHPEIIAVMNKVKMPYNMSTVTQQLLLEALKNQSFISNIIVQTRDEKEKLIEKLQKLSIVKKIYPSDANFILVKMENANEIYKRLTEKKVIVRNRSKVEKCEGCLRITIGTPDENAALMIALSEIIV